MIYRLFVVALTSLLFFQCQAPETDAIALEEFYDLKAFLADEKVRLKEMNASFTKTVSLNGQSETLVIAEPDMDIAFSEFESSDINRVSWYDKYEEVIDETGIHYTTYNEKLAVKSMSIEKTGNDVTAIRILKSTENLLNASQKELEYIPSKGYRLKSIRKSIGEVADTLVIEVSFE